MSRGLDRPSNGLCLGPRREEKGLESADEALIFLATAATIVNRELPMAETVQHFLDAPECAVDGFAPEGGDSTRIPL